MCVGGGISALGSGGLVFPLIFPPSRTTHPFYCCHYFPYPIGPPSPASASRASTAHSPPAPSSSLSSPSVMGRRPLTLVGLLSGGAGDRDHRMTWLTHHHKAWLFHDRDHHTAWLFQDHLLPLPGKTPSKGLENRQCASYAKRGCCLPCTLLLWWGDGEFCLGARSCGGSQGLRVGSP